MNKPPVRLRDSHGLARHVVWAALLAFALAGCAAAPDTGAAVVALPAEPVSVFDVEAGRFRAVEAVPYIVIGVIAIVVLLVLTGVD